MACGVNLHHFVKEAELLASSLERQNDGIKKMWTASVPFLSCPQTNLCLWFLFTLEPT